jgi:hypothetical protein
MVHVELRNLPASTIQIHAGKNKAHLDIILKNWNRLAFVSGDQLCLNSPTSSLKYSSVSWLKYSSMSWLYRNHQEHLSSYQNLQQPALSAQKKSTKLSFEKRELTQTLMKSVNK